MKVAGQFGFDQLALSDSRAGANVVAVERLAATGLAFDGAAHRLGIGDIELLHPDLRIAIAKDRSVNLAQLARQDEAPRVARTASAGTSPAPSATATPALSAGPASSPARSPAPSAAPPPGPASLPAAFDVAVQQVRVREGSVDFSDQSLVLTFATQVHSIDATISGISNDPGRRADVRAKGSIQSYGSASVDGSLVPSDPRRFTDLKVKFNNVLLQPFSPYTATFAGRKVQTGKLWLDLDYKIDHGELLGQNDIRLADFTLGERVASATAIDVPPNLAVSLLTDADGQIRLSVPVRGDLANPRFSVGDAIAHAVGNILSRIVSAPFRLIGRLFGGKGESLASVDFEPGSAALAPPEREKLDTLADALRQRPLLRLVVGAPYDAPADMLALQQAKARRALAATLDHGGGSEAPDASVVAFDEPATRQALQTLARQSGVASGAAAPASSPDGGRARYEELFDRIVRQQPVGAAAAQILATERAGAIAGYLTRQGIDRSRVQTGRVESVSAAPGGNVAAALTIAAVAEAP